MPTDKCPTVGLLDNVCHVVEDDIGAENCFHDVQQTSVRGQLVWRAHNCVHFVEVVKRVSYCFGPLKLLSLMESFSFGQDSDAADEAIMVVAHVKRLWTAVQYLTTLPVYAGCLARRRAASCIVIQTVRRLKPAPMPIKVSAMLRPNSISGVNEHRLRTSKSQGIHRSTANQSGMPS